jgi:hypothetical protein
VETLAGVAVAVVSAPMLQVKHLVEDLPLKLL